MARPKEFNQEAVIDKAVALFRLKGYEATSVQELVDYLGIGRGSLYDTFGSKHALYLAALDRYLAPSGPANDAPDAAAPVKAIIGHILTQQVEQALQNSAGGGCLLVNAAMELGNRAPAVTARVQANLAEAETMFHQLLMRGQASGELTPARDGQAVARALVNASLGIRVMAKVNPSRPALEDIVAVTLSLLD